MNSHFNDGQGYPETFREYPKTHALNFEQKHLLMTYFQTSTEFIYLRNLLCSDFYCMLFLAAVIQRGAIHMLVMK